MSGSVILIPALGMLIPISACYGAGLLLYEAGKAAIKGARAAKKTADQAIEHKRKQAIEAIESEAAQQAGAVLGALRSLEEYLEKADQQVRESFADLEKAKEETARIRQEFLQKEPEFIQALFDFKGDEELKTTISEVRKAQLQYVKAWKDLGSIYMKNNKNQYQLSIVEAAAEREVERAKLLQLSTAGTAPRKAAPGKMGLKESYRRAHEAIEKWCEEKNKELRSVALKELDETERLAASLVFRSHSLKKENEKELAALREYFTKGDLETLRKKCDQLKKVLESHLKLAGSEQYKEREKRYMKLLDRYFHFEGSLRLNSAADLSYLLEELAKCHDEGRTNDFDRLEKQLTSKIKECGRLVLEELGKEALKAKGFERVRRKELHDGRVMVTGNKAGAPMSVLIDRDMNILVDFPKGAMGDDAECHRLLCEVVLELRESMLARNIEVGILDLALRWRAGEEIKSVINQMLKGEDAEKERTGAKKAKRRSRPSGIARTVIGS